MSQENSGSEEQVGQEPADFQLTAESYGQEDLEPPDNKKFHLELDRLIGLIRKGEIKLKSLEKLVSSQVEKTPKREELKRELENLRTQREEEILTRKQHDLDLKGLNMQVLIKNDTCTKLQAGLRYKSESRIDEAVRRLEHQMQVQQLKLSEEKRIVAEIDLLRRTKRNLSEYLVVKQDVEHLRRKQKILRMQRDACVRRITALKSKEEEIKTLFESEVVKESGRAKSEQAQWLNDIEVLKKEVSELQNRKKSMKANFAKERSEYYSAIKEAKRQQREVSRKKTSNERLLLLKEVRVKKEPFEAEKALCDTLISHMERLHTGGIHLSDTQDAQQPPAATAAADKDQTSIALLPSFEDSSPLEGVFLRRKSASDDLVGIYAGFGKMSRRGSRKGRRSSAKEVPRKLNLHPEVVEHLLSLGLSPPSTGADIPKVLEELQHKKDFFDAAKSPNATLEQSTVFMSPITEESPPEFPGTCSHHKVSSSYENGINVCNDIDIQRDASETKRPKTNDLALPVTTSDEVSNKSYISNGAVSNGRKPQKRDTNKAVSVELSERSGPIVESCLPYDNYTLYPAKLTTEWTVVANGSQSDNERTDETSEWDEAVTNKEHIRNTEDHDHGSKDVQSNETDNDSETICSSVLQTDGFCFPSFLNQEAPSVGEKCPA